MPYTIRNLRVKSKRSLNPNRSRNFMVREVDKDTEEDGRTTAKRTTLKKAFYQRVILKTIEQVRHLLKTHDVTKVYKVIHNPELVDRKRVKM